MPPSARSSRVWRWPTELSRLSGTGTTAPGRSRRSKRPPWIPSARPTPCRSTGGKQRINQLHHKSSILGLLLYIVLLFQFLLSYFFSLFYGLDMVKKCTELLKVLPIDIPFHTIFLQYFLKSIFPFYSI